jgi:two-component system nitrate/nitrite response regulator NarL
VIIADDHPLFREGLARCIQERSELELVAQAADGSAAMELIRGLEPDVAVVDLKMPGTGGLAVARTLAHEGLRTHLVLVSAHLDSSLVFEALAAGARAFISKDADRLEVCAAIVAVAEGGVVLPSWLHAGLASEIKARVGDPALALTTREMDVLRLVAEGASAPAVGRALHLSTGTVKSHLTSVYEKLGVNDRAAAVAEAMRRGVLE